ncbi:hypothetical protein HLB35_09215 [Halomonas sp. TBZ9]|uniref:DUF3108 domain-containing protein n=1 Tax=Vreelandella azerica TaxID=2732867 RepID=A0A7Y3TXG4_9GAMM|nr:hypothetical protein [Halomonas azerica]
MAVADNTATQGDLQPLAPFEAQYRLEVSGWPGATITHQLSEESQHWLSDMRFSITIARGQERSRFTADEANTHSLMYDSSYSVLGIGDSYQLRASELTVLDRQTAIIDLARRAGSETCTVQAPCDMYFADHRGRNEHFSYYLADIHRLKVPAGEFDTQSVILFDNEKPDRQLRISFHADYPGLILEALYQKDGKRNTHITLTRLNSLGDSTD